MTAQPDVITLSSGRTLSRIMALELAVLSLRDALIEASFAELPPDRLNTALTLAELVCPLDD